MKYSAQDIRFNTKGNDLYAFCLGKPTSDITIHMQGKDSKKLNNKVASITLLGSNTKVRWKQEADALIIKQDFKIPVEEFPVLGFKIKLM